MSSLLLNSPANRASGPKCSSLSKLFFCDTFPQDYNNHRQEIFSKMVTLMEELFISQLSTVSK